MKDTANPKPINAIGHANLRVPTLELLVKAGKIPSYLSEAARQCVEEFDCELPCKKEKAKDYVGEGNGVTVRGRRLNGTTPWGTKSKAC